MQHAEIFSHFTFAPTAFLMPIKEDRGRKKFFLLSRQLIKIKGHKINPGLSRRNFFYFIFLWERELNFSDRKFCLFYL